VRARYVVPLTLFAALAVVLAVGLTLRPAEIPSALIGKAAPEFALEPVPGYGPGLGTENLKGQISIVNVFSSWCIPCRAEHPLWMEMAQSEDVVGIYGINYKDPTENAVGWLDEYGNPYARTGADLQGRTSIDWGVYGVPETFIVDADGVIRTKIIGPIDRYILDNIVLPKVRELMSP
jgi:cytochrome c biogenesis protein CcmG/thiol:disulfide interchange protein DsbE